MKQTLSFDAWAALSKRQLARALHGDQKAAAWCAKHKPDDWQGYARRLQCYITKLKAHCDRLHLLNYGLSKLADGFWAWGDDEVKAWAAKLADAMRGTAQDIDLSSLTPEAEAELGESLSDLMVVMALGRGLNVALMMPADKAAFARAFCEDGIEALAARLKAARPELALPAEVAARGVRAVCEYTLQHHRARALELAKQTV